MSQGHICKSATLAKLFGLAALVITLSAGHGFAQGIPQLGPEDTAIAIDLDSVFVPAQNNGRYPAAENPPRSIDTITGSKYLNFGAAGSGFIVTPAVTGNIVESFQIRTANDAPGRDPASWQLYGFTGALVTTDSGPSPAINQTGLAEAWNLIDSGTVALPGDPAIGNDQRGVLGPVVNVNGGATSYQHYKMIFPTIKRPTDNIMQMDEIQFFRDEAGSPAQSLLLTTDPIIAVDQIPVPAGWGGPGGSSYPAGERPALAIDQATGVVNFGTAALPDNRTVPNTKYLNFGETNSGIIITNSSGPIRVDTMGLTTANDALVRDPMTFSLYGTNDPITSVDNSNGNGTEVWTPIILDAPTNLPGTLPDGPGPLNNPLNDDARFTQVLIPINASADYSSYRLIFPTVRDAAAANSMQIGDIQFYTIPEPSTWALLALAGLATAVVARRRRK